MPEPDPRFEVPPEYADVYEKAFRSARGDREDDDAAGGGSGPRGPGWWRRHAWGSLAVLVSLVAVAAGAYLLGRAAGDEPSSPPSAVTSAYDTVRPVRPALASSTCEPPTVSDARGRSVSFAPGNALDTDGATSWACSGTAVGEELVLTLPAGSTVSRVGLRATASLSGVPLNRIDSVDWIFADGSTVHQDLSDAPASTTQIQDVPVTAGSTVRLRLSSVTPGPADLTAVSSVYLWAPGAS